MKPRFNFCLSFAFCISVAITAKAQVDVNDSLALVDLYNSTNGSSWKHHDNWLTGPVKDWYGVKLENQRISSIILEENNLTGFIPSSLGNLSIAFLDNDDYAYLDLSYNQLSGNIPPELGKLSFDSNGVLDLSNNQLSGDIPPELGNISNLVYLSLYENKLSGTIPSSLSNLSKLDELLLSYNQLTGVIPPELGNLLILSFLDLSNNQLTGVIPPELSKLPFSGAFAGLDLSHNQLSGNIPPEFGNISLNAYYGAALNLSHNQLSGNISSSLGNLSFYSYVYSSYLDLSYNQLSGNIPPELGNISLLSSLYLSHNKLSGNIPPELSKLSFYHGDFNSSLDLSYNQLSGNIPPEFGQMYNLYDLYLNNNQLSGSIPPELGNIAQYDYNYGNILNLSNNQLSGNIPPELANLSSEHSELDLSHNKLTGSIPPDFYFYSLRLSYNKLEGLIPANIGDSWTLYYLFLDHNKLSGPVPSSIVDLKYLDSLDLSHNHFTFDGMELVAQTFPFAKYNRQAIIPVDLNNNALSVSAGGTLSNNAYQWYKVGQTGSTTITGDSVYRPAEDAKYYAAVTNSVCTQLTLYTDTIEYGSTLPVTIINLTAGQQESVIQLGWTSVTETNVSRYEILRSANSINFSAIGSVQAKDNGAAQQHYSFNDLQPWRGNNYYMLKIIDKDDKSVYSNIVLVGLGKNKAITIVYPNPAKDILHIKTSGNVSFSLLSESGKILLTENINKTGSINISGIAAGIYYLKNNNTNAVEKIYIAK